MTYDKHLLNDYQSRAQSQISSGESQENLQLDSEILDDNTLVIPGGVLSHSRSGLPGSDVNTRTVAECLQFIENRARDIEEALVDASDDDPLFFVSTFLHGLLNDLRDQLEMTTDKAESKVDEDSQL